MTALASPQYSGIMANPGMILESKDPKNRMPICVYSDRVGMHWMDGHPILTTRNQVHVRPWDDCIAIDQLSLENLPPFYVRLRDDQTGHLAHWSAQGPSPNAITKKKLGQVWPWNFDSNGIPLNLKGRFSWGPAYHGGGTFKGLVGGTELPEYRDAGLPPTWTSSWKMMAREVPTSELSDVKKRKASEDIEQTTETGTKAFGTSVEGSAFRKAVEVATGMLDAMATEIHEKEKMISNLEATISENKKTIVNLEARLAADQDKLKSLEGLCKEHNSTINKIKANLGAVEDPVD